MEVNRHACGHGSDRLGRQSRRSRLGSSRRRASQGCLLRILRVRRRSARRRTRPSAARRRHSGSFRSLLLLPRLEPLALQSLLLLVCSGRRSGSSGGRGGPARSKGRPIPVGGSVEWRGGRRSRDHRRHGTRSTVAVSDPFRRARAVAIVRPGRPPVPVRPAASSEMSVLVVIVSPAAPPILVAR